MSSVIMGQVGLPIISTVSYKQLSTIWDRAYNLVKCILCVTKHNVHSVAIT